MYETVGDLRDLLKDVPDEAELKIYDNWFNADAVIETIFVSENEVKIVIG